MNRNDRAIATFTGLGHGTFHGFELTIPLFVPIWLSAFDASPTTLGIVVGAGYALVGLVAPLAGVLSDRYGSKRVVLLSIGGMGLSFASLGAVDSLRSLAVVLVVWGMAAGLYHPAGLSLISRGARRRGTVLAVHGAGGNLGMVAGPLATVGLLLVFDWRLVAVILAVPAAVCVGVGFVLTFDPNDGSASGEPSRTASRRTLGPSIRAFLATSRGLFVGGFVFVFAIQLVYGIYYRGLFTFLPDVLGGLAVFEATAIGRHEIDASQLAYAGLLLIGVFGQYAGGVLSDRANPERALVGTFLMLTVASLLFVPASTTGLLPLLVICAVLGFGVYAFAPISQSLVAEYVPDRRHGLSFGYVYLGTFGVGALGAAVAGAAIEYGGTQALFTTLVALVSVCTVIAVSLLFREHRRP